MNDYILEYVGHWDWESDVIGAISRFSIGLAEGSLNDELYTYYFCSGIAPHYVFISRRHFFITCYFNLQLPAAIDIVRFMYNFSIIYWYWNYTVNYPDIFYCPNSLIGFDIL